MLSFLPVAKRGFFRDFVGVLNSNIFSLICALLISVLLTRVLGAEGYGLFNALVVVPLIVVSLTHLGIRGASIYLLGQKKYPDDQIVSSVLFILVFAGLLGMLMSLLGYYYLDNPDFTHLLIALVLFVIPFRLSIIYITGIFLGKDEIKKANQLNWAINFINLLLAAILVWGMNMDIVGAVISALGANVLVSIWALQSIFKSFTIKFVFLPRIVKHIIRMGLLFSITFFVIQLNYKLDILLLERWSTMTEVGVYSLATQIAEQLWQVPLAIGIVLFSRTANQGDQKELAQTIVPLARLTIWVVSGIALLMFVLAPFLIPLIFGSEFSSSAPMLQLILPGIIIMAVFRVLSGQLEGMGKPHITIYIFIPALMINVGLNYLWIPEYGGLGAAMASNISYVLGAIGYWIYYAVINQVSFWEILRFRKSDFNQLSGLMDKIRSRGTS